MLTRSLLQIRAYPAMGHHVGFSEAPNWDLEWYHWMANEGQSLRENRLSLEASRMFVSCEPFPFINLKITPNQLPTIAE